MENATLALVCRRTTSSPVTGSFQPRGWICVACVWCVAVRRTAPHNHHACSRPVCLCLVGCPLFRFIMGEGGDSQQQQHGKMTFGNRNIDHVGSIVGAYPADEQANAQRQGGKMTFGNRNVDHVGHIVGSYPGDEPAQQQYQQHRHGKMPVANRSNADTLRVVGGYPAAN